LPRKGAAYATGDRLHGVTGETREKDWQSISFRAVNEKKGARKRRAQHEIEKRHRDVAREKKECGEDEVVPGQAK